MKDQGSHTVAEALTAPLDLVRWLNDNLSVLGEALGDGVEMQLEPPNGEHIVAIDTYSFDSAMTSLFRDIGNALPKGGKISLRVMTMGFWTVLDVGLDGSPEQRAARKKPFPPFNMDAGPDSISSVIGRGGGLKSSREFPDGSAVLRLQMHRVE